MSRFREIKREARRDLHQELEVAALYIAPEVNAAPVLVTVRIHTNFAALGDQKGTNFNSAEMLGRQPQIIFLCEQGVVPKRNAIVYVAQFEAYKIGVVHPADDITIKADIVTILKSETIDLPVPEDV